ncbi:TIGR02186 family protein [Pseudosulfitobacter sp. DSM 107133]|uniref:TIGR02186 family protein n=1 Tax=Pseudosulfitobacter sp. DSM 107133 TaxID=2883100 RepID=UPI000DF1AD3F|nr:TIGR02186 family protein [Pseudosulfitobacter sp. DSM 107133]UOA26090.1 hypothetical protein DSM107133_00781 [Pseudosulfitobacter sp. DSM 107133]
MLARLLALLTLCAALPAQAEEVVLGLSRDEVAITASFDGSEILIFGAVRRETPIPDGPPLEVVITVSGPSLPVTVRRKEHRYGIWINTDSVEVDRAPSYYAVATSGPLREVLSNIEDLRYRITVPRAIRSVGAPMTIQDSANFTRALIRIRGNAGLYQVLEGNVAVDQQTLFRTSIQLPSALNEGGYITRIFLTREGKVVSQYQTTIDVRKVGLERWLHALSRNQPMLYGLMSIAIAIAAGWGASAAFALLRR